MMYGVNSFDVMGYGYEGEVYCPQCAAHLPVPLDDDEVWPIFADSESGDQPTSCSQCHELIEDSWSPSCALYVIGRLRAHLVDPADGSAEVLDQWAGYLSDHSYGFDPREDYGDEDPGTILSLYLDHRRLLTGDPR